LKFKIYTDGACRGNPGICAIAFIILDDENRAVQTYSEYIGKGTNNQDEYNALISALELARYFGNEFECYSDSKLLVNQMNRDWKVKHPNIKILWKKAITLKDTFHYISFTHVPRTNVYIQRVDQLANQILDNLEQ
jgi:ribonuclease HI